MTTLARWGRENWLTVLLVVVLAGGYLALRSSPTEVASAEALAASLRAGQPTVVAFYSNL